MKTQHPTATGSTRPGPLQRLGDVVATRLQHLPPATTRYTITRDLRIPMRDGVELLADLSTPAQPKPGTILVRSPYGFATPMAVMMGSTFASRGYRALLVRCRGTFGSGGTFEPMQREVDDAADTVGWMREQSWFDGRLATYGGSYLAFTQWALFMDPPPELKTAMISISPHDFYTAVYQGGALNVSDFLGWSHQNRRPEGDGFVRGMIRQAVSSRRVARALNEIPIVEAGERLLDGRAPWYRNWVTRRDPSDPWWSAMRLSEAIDRVDVPVLLQSGWHDLFLPQTLEQYERLAARGVDVALTMGPWNHIQIATKGGPVIVRENLDWLDEHLAGTGIRTRAAPVKVYVTGAEQWRDLAAWPPPANERILHPQPGGGLGDAPAADGSQAGFTYDPADPTPTIGGRTLLGGSTDDSALAARRDVLTFTGEPLTTPLEVLGTPVVELAHSSDNPHVDVFVRLSEVDAHGRSRNVTEGFVRLDPVAANGVVHLELDATAHRFTAGNRVLLSIAGGSLPRFERNLGTGDDPATSSRMSPSRRTIDLARSRLVLPVTT